jgi:pilus assembly protein CpaE
MEARQKILLVTQEDQINRSVSIALEAGRVYITNGQCKSLDEAASNLEFKPAPVVLVDIDPKPEAMLAELAPLAARFRRTHFVVLASEMRGDLVLSAMRAGARNYVLKRSLVTDLSDVLNALGRDSSVPAERLGSLITVLSAGGGCGATTLAIGLADILARGEGEASIIVDMDVFQGAVGSYLGLESPYGFADVLKHSGRVDRQLVLSTSVAHGDTLRVLLSPATANFAAPAALELRNLERVLQVCRQAAPFTVFDAPRTQMEVAATLCRQSLLTLVVLQQNVKDIRTARTILLGLADRGVPWSSMLPVVNRWRQRTPMVSFQDTQKALGVSAVARVINDFKSALRSMNYGQPVAQAAPGSKLGRHLRELAAEVLAARDRLPVAVGQKP